MKLHAITFCVCAQLVSVMVSAQVRAEQSPEESLPLIYADELKKYKTMKIAGAILTCAGTVIFITGLSMDEEVYDPYGKATNPGIDKGVGVALLGVGIAGGAGIPIWIVGGHNYKKYKKRAYPTARLSAAPHPRGLTLVLKF